jgi:hypothetical protein
MMRSVLVGVLVVAAGVAVVDVAPTLAGLTDSETASGSFTADLCAREACKVVEAKGLDDHECDEDAWRFAITHVDEDTAPRSIHVTWTEGDAAVGLERVTGQTAHYRASSHLDEAVENATARIHEDWRGRFNLGEGPCDR